MKMKHEKDESSTIVFNIHGNKTNIVHQISIMISEGSYDTEWNEWLLKIQFCHYRYKYFKCIKIRKQFF